MVRFRQVASRETRDVIFVSPHCRLKYKVSLAEFKRWLEANGAARGMADEDVEASFNSVDVDHSGTVGADEIDPL